MTLAFAQPLWMPIAWGEYGTMERPGVQNEGRIVGYHAAAGGEAPDEVPWCASFVGWCLVRAGLRGTGSKAARSYAQWGKDMGEMYGAVAVLSRGINPALGHVGFLVGATETDVALLGGNQDNRVCVALYPRWRLVALRVPEGV